MEPPSQPASPNILVIEIGNSHVAVSDVCGGEVRTVQRAALDEIGEARAMLEPMWESLPDDVARAVVIGSVVPAAERRMIEAVEETILILLGKPQNLDGRLLAFLTRSRGILGEVDVGHAAGAELAHHDVAAVELLVQQRISGQFVP